MNWVMIVAGVLFLGFVLLGYSRGFLKTVFGMLQMIVTIVLVLLISPMLKEALRENTGIYEQAKDSVVSVIETQFPELTTGVSVPAELEDPLIEQIATIEVLQNLLKENNTPEVYAAMGVETFVEYVGGFMAELALTIVSFVISFIVVLIALQMVSWVFDVIGMLPLVGGVNKMAGAALGAVEGLLILWLLCLVVTAFSDTPLGAEALMLISESPLLSMIYNNNLVLKIVIAMGMTIA